jgi:hypothetical protein
MRKIFYVIFSLCSIGFIGSTLLVTYVNLLVGFLGFACTYILGVTAMENLDIRIRDTNGPLENTFEDE